MSGSSLLLDFPSVGGKGVTTRFDGGNLSTDAGLVWLRAADSHLALTASLSDALVDRRQQSKVEHPYSVLLSERIYAIAQGYEDANDLDSLRTDPMLKLACGRAPEGGQDLAGQSTLSRFENAVTADDLKRLGRRLAQIVVGQLPTDTVRVILDVDASEDPCHGQQEFEFFNGYYGTHCYLPLYLHVTAVRADGRRDRQRLLSVLLRKGSAKATGGLFWLLRQAIAILRAHFATVQIVLRADSGFGSRDVLRFCALHGINYVLGLPGNSRLKTLSIPIQMDACCKYTFQKESWADGVCREFGSFLYKAGKWRKKERVVVKAEITLGELNPRYVVTDLPDGDEAVYLFYCERGDQENRIKEAKLDMATDRTSCHRFLANQFRVLLHAAAMVLVSVIQDALTGTPYSQALIGTVRLRILKVAARVVETTRRIWLHLCSSYPNQDVWKRLAEYFRPATQVT